MLNVSLFVACFLLPFFVQYKKLLFMMGPSDFKLKFIHFPVMHILRIRMELDNILFPRFFYSLADADIVIDVSFFINLSFLSRHTHTQTLVSNSFQSLEWYLVGVLRAGDNYAFSTVQLHIYPMNVFASWTYALHLQLLCTWCHKKEIEHFELWIIWTLCTVYTVPCTAYDWYNDSTIVGRNRKKAGNDQNGIIVHTLEANNKFKSTLEF